MPQTLANGAVHYRTSPTFTTGKVPVALLKNHSTKAGVWGKIVVLKGQVQYTVPDSDTRIILKPGSPGISQPQVTHFVTPIGDAEFYVEFYKMDQ